MNRHVLFATAAIAMLSPLAFAQTNEMPNAEMMEQIGNLSAEEFVTMAASSEMFESSRASLPCRMRRMAISRRSRRR